MDLIGKTTINPLLFYSGKISGYATWIIILLQIMRLDIIERITFCCNGYISFVLLIAGLIFTVFSMINLGASTRFGLPTEKTVFKTNGLYKISRNPMYVGFDLLTISSMIYTLNFWIIALGIYSIVIYHFIILGEERFLKNRFGEQYSIYLLKIRRYL
jgi:protein-S-isoprenylcysteine O-methyltransferase Ste14